MIRQDEQLGLMITPEIEIEVQRYQENKHTLDNEMRRPERDFEHCRLLTMQCAFFVHQIYQRSSGPWKLANRDAYNRLADTVDDMLNRDVFLEIPPEEKDRYRVARIDDQIFTSPAVTDLRDDAPAQLTQAQVISGWSKWFDDYCIKPIAGFAGWFR